MLLLDKKNDSVRSLWQYTFLLEIKHILSSLVLSRPVLSVLSCPILSYPILSYPILSYPILSYLIPIIVVANFAPLGSDELVVNSGRIRTCSFYIVPCQNYIFSTLSFYLNCLHFKRFSYCNVKVLECCRSPGGWELSQSDQGEDFPSQWRHRGCDNISKLGRFDCLLIVCSGANKRKHQSSASVAFVRGIYRWPVEPPSQRASNAEIVSIWRRHHALPLITINAHRFHGHLSNSVMKFLASTLKRKLIKLTTSSWKFRQNDDISVSLNTSDKLDRGGCLRLNMRIIDTLNISNILIFLKPISAMLFWAFLHMFRFCLDMMKIISLAFFAFSVTLLTRSLAFIFDRSFSNSIRIVFVPVQVRSWMLHPTIHIYIYNGLCDIVLGKIMV